MYQTEKFDVDADSFSSTSSFSDSDNDSDDLAEGITVLTVGGKVVDLSKESKHPPTKDDLSHVCNNIGRRWRKLAFSLGLSRGPVECIEEDFRHEGCYEMAWQALLTWRRQHGDAATLGELVQALDDIGLTKLASELPV